MKHKQMLSLLLAALLVLTLFVGCGAKSAESADMRQETAAAVNGAYPAESPALEEAGFGSTAVLPENRKWIVTVNLDAETEDLDALLETLGTEITALGGYTEDQRVFNGSTYASRRYRNAYLTVRVPAEAVDGFIGSVSGLANVVRNEKTRKDITLQYVSTDSRVKALQTEETRLLELMEKAETMADLLEIEGRLTDVRYELERFASQLRVYDNQVDFATVHLSVEEVQEYTPAAERTVWQRIGDGFLSSMKGLWRGIVEIFVWVLGNLPYLAVCAAVAAALVLSVLRVKKRKNSAKPPKSPFDTDHKEE